LAEGEGQLFRGFVAFVSSRLKWRTATFGSAVISPRCSVLTAERRATSAVENLRLVDVARTIVEQQDILEMPPEQRRQLERTEHT
jgi:hypothetical protein